MSMNFKFSRGYSESQALQLTEVCCDSNTSSADVLVEQQLATARSTGHMLDLTGGL